MPYIYQILVYFLGLVCLGARDNAQVIVVTVEGDYVLLLLFLFVLEICVLLE